MTTSIQLLPKAPSCVFPVVNEVTDNTIYVEICPTNSGVSIIVHQKQPQLEETEILDHETAMAAVVVDYFVDHSAEQKEVVQVQLFDEQKGPADQVHWEIPSEYDGNQQEQYTSILLVHDVEHWAPPQDEVEMDT